MRQPAYKPPARPSDLLTRRVVARANAARFIAEPVAFLGDPAPGRSALEQRERRADCREAPRRRLAAK